MNMSEQIRSHRKDAGLTQEQVAAYLGVSAPAVNKWEKGNTYPDVTLLPALARLLNMDMNELFSFREELTELETGQFANEIAETAIKGNIDAAFEMAAAKIQEYPRCDSLIYMAATTLDGVLVLSDIPEERRETYKKTVFNWLERVSDSADEKIRYSVIYLLAAKYLQMEEYEKSGSFWGGFRMFRQTKHYCRRGFCSTKKRKMLRLFSLKGICCRRQEGCRTICFCCLK